MSSTNQPTPSSNAIEVESFSDGAPVLLRFTGRELSNGDGLGIFLTDEDAVILVYEDQDYDKLETVDDFAAWVQNWGRNQMRGDQEQALTVALAELDITRVIEP